MKLRVTKQILEENIPLLKLDTQEAYRLGDTIFQLKNSKDLQKAISAIDKLDLFKERIEKIKTYPLYTHSKNSLFFSKNEIDELYDEMAHLKEECTNLSNALSKLIAKENPNLISIKIPSPQNFADLEKTITALNKIFSQTLFADEIKGGVQIANFDNGTYWIDVVAIGGVAKFIGALAWSGAVAYKKLQEGRLVQEKVKELKIKNEAFQEIIEKSKEAVNQEAQREADFLYKTFYKGDDNEQIGRIKLAIKELAELYSQGAEIHPALEAPDEIKNEFPDFKAIDRIETKIHKLEVKKK